jgi:hypothetical protein
MFLTTAKIPLALELKKRPAITKEMGSVTLKKASMASIRRTREASVPWQLAPLHKPDAYIMMSVRPMYIKVMTENKNKARNTGGILRRFVIHTRPR